MKKHALLCLISWGSTFSTLSAMVSNAPTIYKEDLSVSSMKDNPMEQLIEWQSAASKHANFPQLTFALATVTKEGVPSVRMMTMKELNNNGFSVIGTTDVQPFDSHPFQEMKVNPNIAACFFWEVESRQVCLEGTAYPLSKEALQRIFKDRPKDHQVTSTIFSQIQPGDSAEKIKQIFDTAMQKYKDKEVPLPDSFGGYTITPTRVSFWQKGEHNIHSRVIYTLASDGKSWDKQLIIN